jgi:hypothetical protein
MRGPRLIFAAPTLMTLALRRYFMPFIHCSFVHRVFCGISVGLNCDSVEWGHLYRYLSAFGLNCIAGDFSNFDQKLPAIVNGLALNVIYLVTISINSYSDKDKLAMITLLQSMLNHHVLIDRSIFAVRGPNPSGQALTTHTNCVSVLILLLYVWSKYYPVDEFFDGCRFAIYGDDHVIVVKPKYDKFTYDAIYRELKTVNIDYTTFSKESACDKTYDSLLNVQFLKRSFHAKGKYMLAPLDISSFQRRMYLSKRKTINDPLAVLSVMSSLWQDSFTIAEGPNIRSSIAKWAVANFITLSPNLFPTLQEFVDRRVILDEAITQYFGYSSVSPCAIEDFY